MHRTSCWACLFVGPSGPSGGHAPQACKYSGGMPRLKHLPQCGGFRMCCPECGSSSHLVLVSWCLRHGAGGKGPRLPVFASRGTNEKTLLLSLHGGHRALSTVAQPHRNMHGCSLSQEASPESERGTGYAFADRPQIACENAFVSCQIWLLAWQLCHSLLSTRQS